MAVRRVSAAQLNMTVGVTDTWLRMKGNPFPTLQEAKVMQTAPRAGHIVAPKPTAPGKGRTVLSFGLVKVGRPAITAAVVAALSTLPIASAEHDFGHSNMNSEYYGNDFAAFALSLCVMFVMFMLAKLVHFKLHKSEFGRIVVVCLSVVLCCMFTIANDSTDYSPSSLWRTARECGVGAWVVSFVVICAGITGKSWNSCYDAYYHKAQRL
jgi:hypothetical protein